MAAPQGPSGTGCFSFHPSKNLAAAGDAGALVTNSDDLDSRMRPLRELGQRGQNNHIAIGLNSKLDAIQARVLSCKLPWLDQWNLARNTVAGWYRERLEGLPLTFQSTGFLPSCMPTTSSRFGPGPATRSSSTCARTGSTPSSGIQFRFTCSLPSPIADGASVSFRWPSVSPMSYCVFRSGRTFPRLKSSTCVTASELSSFTAPPMEGAARAVTG